MAKNYRKDIVQDLKNVYLTGFMCAGKTSVGRVLARGLGRTFADTDLLLAEKYGVSAASLIRNRGLARFRNIEASLVRALARGRGRVVAFGGGVYPSPRWRGLLRATGVTVFLECPWRSLESRLKKERSGRPLLDGAWKTALARARNLYAKRLPFYRRADITVRTAGLTPDKTAERVEKALERAVRRLKLRGG